MTVETTIAAVATGRHVRIDGRDAECVLGLLDESADGLIGSYYNALTPPANENCFHG